MPRCIYCLRDATATAFTSREHVIPAALGSFSPLNPTLTAREALVCDTCNRNVFGPLENIFIEDTLEGIQAQRLNLQNRNSVTIRDNHFKSERLAGFGDEFFDQMFFFLKPEDGKIVLDLKNQIKLRRFRGGYRVFLPEALESIQEDSVTFRRIAVDLQNLDQKDMCIFGQDHDAVRHMIGLLHKFGVTYKEKKSRWHGFEPGQKFEIHEDYTCTINKDLARVLTKIAFNYFAYCAFQSGQQDVLYSEHFNTIRTFALSGTGPENLKEIIPSVNEEPILYEERNGARLIAHIINFRIEDGHIVCRLTFFGLQPIYKIMVGTVPTELADERFGCGHAFDPLHNTILNISQTQPVPHPTPEQVRTTFGLFKRL